MTDPPRTMALTPVEWRQLVVIGANTFANWAGSLETAAPSPDDLAAMQGHLNRLKLQVAAWTASTVTAAQPVASVPEPVAEPKRHGGWPKGRKRGPRQRLAPNGAHVNGTSI